MADNTIIQSPSSAGDTISTEDIGGGVKISRSKIAIGNHGTDGGDVTTSNPFPVTVVDGTSNVVATGNVAGAASDSGNPVKIGAVYNSVAPTYTTGQRADLQTDSHGNLQVAMATKLDPANDGVSARMMSGVLSDSSNNSVVVQTAFGTFSSSGANSLVSGVSGKQVTVLAYRIQATNAASATNTVKFVDTAGTPATVSMSWDLNAREGVVATAPAGSFEFKTGTGLGLQLNLSAAQPLNVMIQYVQF